MGAASFTVFAERDRHPTGLVESRDRRFGRGIVLEQGYGPWPNAETAMAHLGEDDRHENGHMHPEHVGGKHGLVHIATVEDEDAAMALAERLLEGHDGRISDKRGPAGCITIRTGDSAFLFFGYVAT